MNRPIRVLIAKPGLDGHDRGAKVVARALRDGGFEVIYTGLHQTPQMVVNAALQEDVDIIGLSIHSGAHLPLVSSIQAELRKANVRKPLFVGGIIPPDDSRKLKSSGVAAVFGPGSSLKEICARVAAVAEGARGVAAEGATRPAAKEAKGKVAKAGTVKKSKSKAKKVPKRK